MMRDILIGLFSFFSLFSIASAGKIWIEPSEGQMVAGCPFELTLFLDTQGLETSAVGVSLYDEGLFGFEDINTAGAIFPGYTNLTRTYARYGDKKGEALLSFMGTTAQKQGFSGSGVLAKIRVIPVQGVSTLDVDFYHLSGVLADDTNINYFSGTQLAEGLTEAVGGHYTVIESGCSLSGTSLILSGDTPVILRDQHNNLFFKHEKSFLSLIVSLCGQYLWIIVGSFVGIVLLSVGLIIYRKK